jgi:hypothetical protein
MGGRNFLPPLCLSKPHTSDLALVVERTGGRLVKHAHYYWLFLTEGHLDRRRFGAMLGRIALLPIPMG